MPLDVMILAILFVYGTIIGSFLNVVILRTPLKEQIVKGRSHCMSCGHTLAWYDLFPILSWITLRGKCRYCKVSISGRYALVELLGGVAFALSFWTFGLTIPLAFAIVLFPVLICASFFDIDTGEIEYWCPITIASLGVVALTLTLMGATDTMTWYEHLIGAVIVSVPFAVLAFFGAMGGADVQLMAASGLLLGWNIVPAAFIGIFLGAIVGVFIKIFRNPTPQKVYEGEEETAHDVKGTVMRFGPCLSVGIGVSYLYGEQIIEWYLKLMRFA
ncbi:MAG: prepilin peptidase [Oscillospiraceae bacterium]|nr:prepilin peptidase [Oscillospiraceae bacterium]